MRSDLFEKFETTPNYRPWITPMEAMVLALVTLQKFLMGLQHLPTKVSFANWKWPCPLKDETPGLICKGSIGFTVGSMMPSKRWVFLVWDSTETCIFKQREKRLQRNGHFYPNECLKKEVIESRFHWQVVSFCCCAWVLLVSLGF